MSRYWSGLIPAAVVAATAALGAQGQNPANSPPADAGSPAGVQRTTPSPSAQTRTDTVTVTGCLQNAPMASAGTAGASRGSTGGSAAGADSTRGAGTSGNTASNAGNASTTGAAASGRQFVLNSAAMTATGKPASETAVGTSGTSATSYMLQGESATLTPHLNHRVEITGTVQSSPASTTGAANARTGATASGPTLRVDSVKMLAETCDAAPGTTATPPANTPQPQR